MLEAFVEVAADLLRAPALSEQLRDDLAQLRVGVEAQIADACAALASATVRVKRSVAATPAAARVTAQLP